jgi:hypothetical protein
MRRWIAPGAIALVGALGILALWTVRASGGVCVDGAYEDTGEFYGYCADYSSASGALPATIAIVLLVAAGFVFSRRLPAVTVNLHLLFRGAANDQFLLSAANRSEDAE